MSIRTSSPAVPFLLLCGPLAVWWIRPPGPVGAEAPSASFSAERAARHLAWIAAEPRPAFGARNALVRERLARELAALGLEVETQVLPVAAGAESVGGGTGSPASPQAAEIREPDLEGDPAAGAQRTSELVNVLARRRGSGSGEALLLAAHHDSVAAGPGAADDGAAVAAVLEALRALGAGPRTNDLIVLLSDGEELGLLGARAFAGLHPWAADVRAVLNFEARGAGGPSILFQSGPRSAGLIERYAESAPHPFGTSLATAVYERMPNDTDFSVFLRLGLPGLNFAFLGGGAAYHRASDTPDELDPGSLQQHGEAMLALLGEVLDADLEELLAEGELEFFPLPGGLARYPRRWTPWAAIALALVVTAACARRAALAALAGVLGALFVSAAGALGALGLALGTQALVLRLVEAGGWWSGVEPGANLRSGELLTVGAWWSALGVGLALLRLLQRGASAQRVHAAPARGALLVWSFLAVALALAVPGGGHVGLCALLGAALAHAARSVRTTRARSLLACVAWLPAALVLFPLLALFVQVGSVDPAAEIRLGCATSGGVLLAALPLCAPAGAGTDAHAARADGSRSPAAPAWRGAAAVLLAGGLALVGSAVLRAAGQ